MAGRGPAPKDPAARRRRNASEPATVVVPDGEVHGPDLPASYPAHDGEQWVEAEWPDQTVVWWETWRRSGQAKMFTDTDWSFLLDTALMHAEFWTGNRSVGAELRLRVAKFGATPEDRARLKIEVAEPGAKPAPTAAAKKTAASRKGRLLKVVGGEAS